MKPIRPTRPLENSLSRSLTTGLALAVVFMTCSTMFAAEPARRDIEYATADGRALRLDFYAATNSDPSKTAAKSPLIVWVHGGAWRAGSKASVPIASMTERGFAIASVDYRLSGVAKFPAQIHDIKAAIRFLRSRSNEFNVDPGRFFVAGSSAGGHLAALVGVSGKNADLEGNLGSDQNTSSQVQAIVSFFGASNLETILSQSTPHGLGVRVPALKLLLGNTPDQVPELARLASPVAHVDPADPPLLLLHGDQDPQMPINQAHELQGKYEALGLPCQFKTLHGAAHGGKAFYESELLDEVAEFLLSRSVD